MLVIQVVRDANCTATRAEGCLMSYGWCWKTGKSSGLVAWGGGAGVGTARGGQLELGPYGVAMPNAATEGE